jgi:putative copper resistance protein D
MSWFGAEIDGPLVLTRTIHFAASTLAAGGLLFRSLVAEPALRSSVAGYAIVQSRLLQLIWLALGVTVVTGFVWLTLETMSMASLDWGEAVRSGAMLTVVDETQFGLVSEIRAALALLVAACVVLNRFALSRWIALAAGLALVAAIAWTGHAGSTLGELGYLHLAADVLHLCAASAWLGGLVGLALLFALGRRQPALEWRSLQLDAIRRFSILGVISVAALILSGFVNAWILVGSFRALLATDYGRLLLLKLGTFATMVGFAGVNRFWLTPQLASPSKLKAQAFALSALWRNTLIEIALGLVIVVIVAALGTMHPAIHFAQ